MSGNASRTRARETAEETCARYWRVLCIYAGALDAISRGEGWGNVTDPKDIADTALGAFEGEDER